MADDDKNTDKGPKQPEVFSLEDIDKLLEEDNPEFAAGLKDITSQAEEMDGVDIETIQVEGIDKEEAEEKEPEEEKKPNFIQKIKLKVKAKIKAVKDKVKSIWAKTFASILLFFQELIIYMRTGFPEKVKYYRARLKENITKAIEFIKRFKELSLQQKIVLAILIPCGLGVVVLLGKTLTGGWLPQLDEPLPTELISKADKKFEYNRKEETSVFNLAFPQSEFTVHMEKVVVNLRRHNNSGPNPMGAFDFYVAADAQETAIEIKDRQREFLDHVQRALESFSYEEASTYSGKQRMKEEIRKTLNHHLNQGRVYSVYFNTFIVKP